MRKEAQLDTQQVDSKTVAAAQRTLMAGERTLMAWVRTALSMISFGITIYKLLDSLQRAGTLLPRDSSPRDIGMLLIGLGTLSMGLGAVEFWRLVRDLRSMKSFSVWRSSFIVALIMLTLGVALFVGVLARAL